MGIKFCAAINQFGFITLYDVAFVIADHPIVIELAVWLWDDTEGAPGIYAAVVSVTLPLKSRSERKAEREAKKK